MGYFLIKAPLGVTDFAHVLQLLIEIILAEMVVLFQSLSIVPKANSRYSYPTKSVFEYLSWLGIGEIIFVIFFSSGMNAFWFYQ